MKREEIRNTDKKEMKPAKRQLLRDPNIQPTNDVISEALGDAYSAYLQFISHLEGHGVQLEWRYYTDGKA